MVTTVMLRALIVIREYGSNSEIGVLCRELTFYINILLNKCQRTQLLVSIVTLIILLFNF